MEKMKRKDFEEKNTSCRLRMKLLEDITRLGLDLDDWTIYREIVYLRGLLEEKEGFKENQLSRWLSSFTRSWNYCQRSTVAISVSNWRKLECRRSHRWKMSVFPSTAMLFRLRAVNS